MVVIILELFFYRWKFGVFIYLVYFLLVEGCIEEVLIFLYFLYLSRIFYIVEKVLRYESEEIFRVFLRMYGVV